jgi:hypothetical protein
MGEREEEKKKRRKEEKEKGGIREKIRREKVRKDADQHIIVFHARKVSLPRLCTLRGNSPERERTRERESERVRGDKEKGRKDER